MAILRVLTSSNISNVIFFFLLKPEGFDSVSSLGFRDSFSAKLSRIWQIASRDSVTIFLFHETCKRVFFPSDLPYCLVRTLKSRKSFPIPSPKGLNEREKKFRDYGKRFIKERQNAYKEEDQDIIIRWKGGKMKEDAVSQCPSRRMDMQ